MQNKWAEFITEPEIAPRIPPHRFNIEVSTREQALRRRLVHDREGNAAIGIRKLHEAIDGHCAIPTLRGLEAGPHAVQPQQEIRRIRLRPVPVVGQHPVFAPARIQHGREPLHWLAREGERDPVDGIGTQQGPRAWSVRESIRRQHRSPFEHRSLGLHRRTVELRIGRDGVEGKRESQDRQQGTEK
jgi:hypothetical protein